MPALKKWEVAAVLAILATALLTPAGIYMAFKRWETDHYRALIASEVELAGVLSVEGESHFREGCGIAVFALAPAARDRFEAPGGSGRLAGWEETPYRVSGDGLTLADRWLSGFACASGTNVQARTVRRALDSPGSFVKRRAESALIVVPAAGLAALVHDG